MIGSTMGAAGQILASAVATSIANKEGRRAAREQRAWAEKMASMAHQIEVEDLKKAGLNPILSAGGSGASVPSGTSAAQVHKMDLSSLPSAFQAFSNMKLASQQAKAANSSSAVNSANAEKIKADTALTKSTMAAKTEQEHQKALKLRQEREFLETQIENGLRSGKKTDHEIQNLKHQSSILKQQEISARNKNTLFEKEYARMELENLLKEKNLDWFTISNSAKAAKDFSAAVHNLGDTVGMFLPKGVQRQFMRTVEQVVKGRRGNYTRTVERSTYK